MSLSVAMPFSDRAQQFLPPFGGCISFSPLGVVFVDLMNTTIGCSMVTWIVACRAFSEELCEEFFAPKPPLPRPGLIQAPPFV